MDVGKGKVQYYCPKCGCEVEDVGEKCHCELTGPEKAMATILETCGDITKADYKKMQAAGNQVIDLLQTTGLTLIEQLLTLDKLSDSLRESLQALTHEVLAEAGIGMVEVLVRKDNGEIESVQSMDPNRKIDPSKLAAVKERIKPQVDEVLARLLNRQTKAHSQPSPDSFPAGQQGKA